MEEMDINQQAAEQIRRTGRWNETAFHLGEAVALLDGKVVAVAKNLGDALRALRALDPNPRRGMLLEVRPPVVDVIR
jgi:hypothetical protein